MKNVVPYLFGFFTSLIIYSFAPRPTPEPQIPNFQFIENVDEMGDTPEEVYIGIGEKLYKVDTETYETLEIY